MTKEMRLNAFMANTAIHQMPGMWRHPRDQSLRHGSIEYWQELARILERGLFDAVFLTDSVGANDVHGGSLDAAVRHGLRLPRHDPWCVVPLMAAVTQHLGFAVTGAVACEEPYLFARRVSTLDHLTRGRMAWNIVTSLPASGARAMGRDGVLPVDLRYDIGEEFMDVVYKLWEGSWDDGALRHDKASGLFADPRGVRRIAHHGEYFDVEGVHMTEPSPQRTPVLYQAGASERGHGFAATHAECVFLSGRDEVALGESVFEVRSMAMQAGRDPDDITFMMGATVVVAETDALAKAKVAQYYKYLDMEALLGLMSGTSGVDLSTYDLDDPYPESSFAHADPPLMDVSTCDMAETGPTIRDVLQRSAFGRGPLIVGSPERVADKLQSWMERTGVNGFNLVYGVMPADFEDVAVLLVPELQRRGLYKQAYSAGTLREKMRGTAGPVLPDSHPAARYRGGLQVAVAAPSCD